MNLLENVQVKEKYDLIFSDALLTKFQSGDRRKVLGNWVSLLKPGGRIVTTVPIGNAPVSAATLQKVVLSYRGRWPNELPASCGDVAEMAAKYVANIQHFGVSGIEEIQRELVANGCEVTHGDSVVVTRRHWKSRWLYVAATKRAAG